MDKVFKIIARSENADLLHDLIREQGLDVGCTGGITFKDNNYSIDIYASEREVTTLQEKVLAEGLTKKISLETKDITDHVSDRLKEVGTGNRYEGTKGVPHGLGKKVKQ